MKKLLIPLVVCVAALLFVLSPAVPAHAQAKTGWLENEAAALARARADKKLVLMNFTGSDWCPWCVRLDREIFSTPEFKQYAKDHLVLLEVDFPKAKAQPLQVARQNQTLAQEYGVETFPTLIVLDSQGKPVKAFEGYDPSGGPKGFIAELQKIKG